MKRFDWGLKNPQFLIHCFNYLFLGGIFILEIREGEAAQPRQVMIHNSPHPVMHGRMLMFRGFLIRYRGDNILHICIEMICNENIHLKKGLKIKYLILAPNKSLEIKSSTSKIC